ncbi:unnamed protein product, partial [Amoebophrya sp. A120]|eukprot:GSA120T00006758001.1
MFQLHQLGFEQPAGQPAGAAAPFLGGAGGSSSSTQHDHNQQQEMINMARSGPMLITTPDMVRSVPEAAVFGMSDDDDNRVVGLP